MLYANQRARRTSTPYDGGRIAAKAPRATHRVRRPGENLKQVRSSSAKWCSFRMAGEPTLADRERQAILDTLE